MESQKCSEKLLDLLERKGYHLMTIFMIIQCIFFILYSVILFVDEVYKDLSIEYKIYMCLVIALFIVFMIHFAYHSVNTQ